MAAVIDMGEVDEIHSKEETIKDGIILNGDVSSVKSNEEEEEEEEENDSVPNDEVMEVEDGQESDENDVEATSIEIDDDDSNDSNAVILSKSDTNDKDDNDDNEVEIHSVDNSDDEVSEIIDEEAPKETKVDEVLDDDDDDEDVVHVITENDDDDRQTENEEDKEKDGPCEESASSKEKDEEKAEKEVPIILNDSGDGDVEIIESDLPKENGKSYSPELSETHKIDDDDDDDDEVITLDTPTKKAKKTPTLTVVESPRRSARNLNKKVKKSYVEREEKISSDEDDEDEEESDIEEVLPQDPLAVADPLSTHHEKPITYSANKKPPDVPVSSTIVVKDTKRLVEIASKSTPNNSGKKEPTLVIIDTNSILSGRGPIPINQKPTISQSFPVLPMALPAQGVYPPNMRATITPIPPLNTVTHSHTPKPPPLQQSPAAIQFPQLQTTSVSTTPMMTSQTTLAQATHAPVQPPQAPQPPQPPPAPILPSLTDDMFVVEAPSFIVPYVYEKPPVKDLKEFVDKFAKEIRERIRAEERERQARLEAEEKERQLAEEKKKESDAKKDKEDGETDKEKSESAEEDAKSQEDAQAKEDDSKNDKKEPDADQIDDKKEDVETALEKSIIPKNAEDRDKIEEIKAIVENKLSETKQVEKKEIPRLPIDFEEPVRSTSSSNKPYSYFESPLGKFFIDIGHNLVQEYVQTDLLKQQKRKREREGGKNPETNKTITSLIKNLEYTKENNEPYHMPIKKCEFCSFKTESALAMSFHLETPHMKNFVYRCNFCPYEIRSPHDILFHMEAEHMIRGRLERAPAFHQCPNCPFEDNQKGKLSRHMVACSRKFKPDRNLDPPLEWEPPAKIPRVPRMKQSNLTSTAAMYQAMTKTTQYQLMQKMQNAQSALNRGRGRPSLGAMKPSPLLRPPAQSMIYKSAMSGGSVLLPTNYQLSGNQLYQVVGGPEMGGRIGTGAPMTLLPNISSATSTLTIQKGKKMESESGQLFNPTNLAGLKQQTPTNKSKPMHQPSISITPLPRNTSAPQAPASKPGDSNSKNSFVICEICDGYIKDLEQLRNHMQWIHKVKIHPKMIYNRPPLNCQKCQFRFFTDQGLERHLLGSHGLVTSSMQEAANKSKDSGRCPVCGRVYQWKLLNHVARDHNMTLKPAHLSYKCTVCTATFGMYKQFENHVYSAHSVVAKRVMDKKAPSPAQPSSNTSAAAKNNDSLLKPLKINDEITIIPQIPKSSSTSSSSGATSSSKEESSASSSAKNSISVTTTPSTSKTELTRAERLARRKTSAGLDN